MIIPMFGNLLLVLTTISYIALAVFNFQKLNAAGDRLVGAALFTFALIAVYVVFSLLLTISVASKGGFNWISTSISSRNIAIGLLWFGMVAGVVFCSMFTTEYHTDRSIGIFRLISIPVYFGSIWLPLLMLIPYAILLNQGWRDAVSPYLYKLPLIVGCVAGILIYLAPRIVLTLGITVPQKVETAEELFEQTLKNIEAQPSIESLLQYDHGDDDRLRAAVMAKMKSIPDWEGELIKILEKTDEYGLYDFRWVYVFLDDHKVDHPEKFIQPINNTIPVITAGVHRAMEKSFLYTGDLNLLNIDVVCRVLNEQFKDSSNVFRPNMMKLQEALAPPSEEKPDTQEDFIELRNRYQLAVENWLKE